jgi:photosystem II stability/assembly factor-like uncharacterized protein
MKKKCSILAFFVLVSSCYLVSLLSAESEKPIQLKDSLFGADFVGEANGWAVGYYGSIIHTSDGGNTWVYQKSGTEKLLSGVDFVDQNNGWVVGYGPTILHTVDGGKTWAEQNTEEDIFLTAVHFANGKKGWAVGEWGTILYTEDGGENWSTQFSGDDAILYSVDFADELHGWAAGEFGTIFHTEDGGKTWNKQPSGVVNVFFASQALDSENIWVVGIDSLVLQSKEGGMTWAKVDTGSQQVRPYYGVNFRNQENGIVCGQGAVMFTEDGGATWQHCEVDTSIDYIWLYDVVYTNSTTAWMVGEKGRIFKSDTNGKAWKEITY